MASIPSISSEGNLSRYLQEIRKFPMLAQDEEFMLAKRAKATVVTEQRRLPSGRANHPGRMPQTNVRRIGVTAQCYRCRLRRLRTPPC